jgi:hypothetical protein
MPRKVRDLVGTILALVVLVGALTIFDTRVREGVSRFADEVARSGSQPFISKLSDATAPVVDIVRDFSADNTFLFTFLVAAVVLVVMMLRA